MTKPIDLDPAALEAATEAVQNDEDATLAAAAISAYLSSARSAPEAGKAVDFAQLLTNCAQIIDVVKGEWSKEGAWSEWDQSVRDDISRALAALASPAPSGAAEPVAWRYRDFADGWIYTTEINREYAEMTGVAFEPLYAAPLDDAELLEATEVEVKRILSPQATATWGDSGPIPGQHFGDEFADAPQAVAPAEEITETLRKLSELDDTVTYGRDAVKIDADTLGVIREATAALTSLSADKAKLVEWAALIDDRASASEAEASDLRRKLEETTRERDEFLLAIDRSPAGPVELRAQLAYDRHRAEAAERKLEEHRKALEPFRKLSDEMFRYFDDGTPRDGDKNDNAAVWGYNNAELTYGDFRRVRALTTDGGAK